MLRFAANVSMLFTELPLPQRFAAAAAAGFDAVEMQFPYDYPIEELRDALQASGVPLVLINLPAGDWAAGERGLACQPANVQRFRAGLAQGIAYARALGVPQLNALAGLAPSGVPDDTLRATFVDNLRHAAAELDRHGLGLLTEPINRFDVPGFWLQPGEAALALIDAVASPKLRLQHDLYHAQRSQGELVATLQRWLPRIGHIQIADNPGRHEPGSGEIHWPFVLRALQDAGYTGWVGCEYRPAAGTVAGLGWLAAMRQLLAR